MPDGFQIDNIPSYPVYGGWAAANQGLSDIGAGIGQWARQQQALRLAEQQRQNDLQDQIKLLTVKAQLENQFKSPLDLLIERSKAAEAAQTLGNESLYNQIRGVPSQPSSPYNMGNFNLPSSGGIFIPSNMNRVEQTLTGGLPNGLSLMPKGSFNVNPPFNPMQDYQLVPSGELNPFGKPKMKFELKPEIETKRKIEEQKKLLELKSQVPTIQQRNDLTAVNNQLSNLNQIEKLANSVPSGISGAFGTAAQFLTSGGMSKNTRMYLKNRPAYAVSIYRALTGDTRLSDSDAKARALPLLWHPSEPAELRTRQFESIRNALLARKNLIERGQYSMTKDGEYVTPLEDVLAESGANFGGNIQQPQQQGISPESARQELIRRGVIKLGGAGGSW